MTKGEQIKLGKGAILFAGKYEKCIRCGWDDSVKKWQKRRAHHWLLLILSELRYTRVCEGWGRMFNNTKEGWTPETGFKNLFCIQDEFIWNKYSSNLHFRNLYSIFPQNIIRLIIYKTFCPQKIRTTYIVPHSMLCSQQSCHIKLTGNSGLPSEPSGKALEFEPRSP